MFSKMSNMKGLYLHLLFAAISLALFSACRTQQPTTPPMEDWTYRYPIRQLRLEDSLQIAYVDEGKGPQTLLFIHGLGSNLQAWNKTIEALSPHYRCIALDLPGYGKSSQRDYPFSMAFFAEQISAFCQQLRLKQLSVVGHSMGGQIALHLALQKPAFLKKLVLLAPAGFETFSEQDQLFFQAFMTPQVILASTEEQIRANFAINFHGGLPEDAAFMVEDRLKMREDSAAYGYYSRLVPACVQAMLQAPVFDSLPAIPYPSLVLFGANDQLIPNTYLHPQLSTQQVAEAGSQALPQAQLQMIEAAGHFVQWDQAAAVAAAMQAFLAQ